MKLSIVNVQQTKSMLESCCTDINPFQWGSVLVLTFFSILSDFWMFLFLGLDVKELKS